MRDTIAAEFGDRYGVDGQGWWDAPRDIAQRLGHLRADAAKRRALRQRCLAVAWKCRPLDAMFDDIDLAADLFAGIQTRGGAVAMDAMEFVQGLSPSIDPDELKAATDRVLDFLDGGSDD